MRRTDWSQYSMCGGSAFTSASAIPSAHSPQGQHARFLIIVTSSTIPKCGWALKKHVVSAATAICPSHPGCHKNAHYDNHLISCVILKLAKYCFSYVYFFFSCPVADKVNCLRPSNDSIGAAIIFVCRPASAFIIWQYLSGKEWDLCGTLSGKEIWHLISSHLFKSTTTQKIDFSVQQRQQQQFRLSISQWFGEWRKWQWGEKKNDRYASFSDRFAILYLLSFIVQNGTALQKRISKEQEEKNVSEQRIPIRGLNVTHASCLP